MRTEHGYDFARHLSDLCQAWDSNRRPIAAEILGEIARLQAVTDAAAQFYAVLVGSEDEPGWSVVPAATEWLALQERLREAGAFDD